MRTASSEQTPPMPGAPVTGAPAGGPGETAFGYAYQQVGLLDTAVQAAQAGADAALKAAATTAATITPGTDADVTVAAGDYVRPILVIATGSWTAGHNVILPNTAGAVWVIANGSAYSAVAKTAAGTGVTVATTKTAIVRGDGTNIVRVTADA